MPVLPSFRSRVGSRGYLVSMSRGHHNDHLRSVPLFAELDDDELDSIGSALTELRFSAGETLLRQGSYAREMVIIVDGELVVSKNGIEIATIGRGGFAGEIGLLTDSKRNATVAAKSDVTVLHLDARSFDSVLNEAPELAVKMLPIVAERAVANGEQPTD